MQVKTDVLCVVIGLAILMGKDMADVSWILLAVCTFHMLHVLLNVYIVSHFYIFFRFHLNSGKIL